MSGEAPPAYVEHEQKPCSAMLRVRGRLPLFVDPFVLFLPQFVSLVMVTFDERSKSFTREQLFGIPHIASSVSTE